MQRASRRGDGRAGQHEVRRQVRTGSGAADQLPNGWTGMMPEMKRHENIYIGLPDSVAVLWDVAPSAGADWYCSQTTAEALWIDVLCSAVLLTFLF